MSPSAPPNQSANAAASVHSRHTRPRGAAKTRVSLRPASPKVSGSSIAHPLLCRPQALVEALEARLPEGAVALEPVRGVAERRAGEASGPQLCRPTSCDEARALEHLEVLRDRLHADGERRGELGDGGVALAQPREDCPPRRV